MPKIIELTLEISIKNVSCPGVWLCQDGRVCLSVFALGSSYQTCLLPPVFPLIFKDVFYFKKRFQQTCALNNICCFLKDETMYCELIQCTEDCVIERSIILAQFLGAMNDVLFPPNVCSNDSVDLLMRRSKYFPGILSPKIEIATKIRLDEVWHQSPVSSSVKVHTCPCTPREEVARQKQVCHSAKYHRIKCNTLGPGSRSRSRSRTRSWSKSRSRSGSAGSCCSSKVPKPSCKPTCYKPKCSTNDAVLDVIEPQYPCLNADRLNRAILESRYIDHDKFSDKPVKNKPRKYFKTTTTPCVCEICKRYHEFFHTNGSTNEKASRE